MKRKIFFFGAMSLLLFGWGGCSDDGSGGNEADSYEGDHPGECGDDADNDHDGNFDCMDDGCIGSPVCTQGNPDTKSEDDTDSVTGTVDSGISVPADGKWLRTNGNMIEFADGSGVFRGRGANIHDTRSCWACAWFEPNVSEVTRRIDTLVDDWGANFMRLCLESYDSQTNATQVQWQSLLDDEEYLDDIVEIVAHIGTKPGVYVLVSLWNDPSIDDMGWPTAATNATWEVLAERLLPYPHVMFGIINEPRSNSNGAQDGDVWERMNAAVAAIRAIEDAHGSPQHIITVQGTRGWARHLGYYVDHPITAGGGTNIAYETHSYLRVDQFAENWLDPSATLPVIIGEFGPATMDGVTYMTEDDCRVMIDEAEQRDVSWLAWTFHQRCGDDNSLLVDIEGRGCGVDMELTPTGWGTLIRDSLATPWNSK